MKNSIHFQSLIGLAALAASSALAQDTWSNALSVTDVTYRQERSSQRVTIGYQLANDGDPAIIQLDVLTNGVSIGSEHLRSLTGDISSNLSVTVSEGPNKKIYWDAYKDWPQQFSTNATVRIYAYYTNRLEYIPNIYMVVDLSKGTAATASDPYPVSYTFTGPDPKTDTTCLSNKLWLKHIEPDTFMMGRTSDEAAYTESWMGGNNREIRHQVTLSHPFFAGIVPVTREQYKLVMGAIPSNQSGTEPYCPVNKVNFSDLRGSNLGTNWPSSSEVDANSFFSLLRQRTNIGNFDLPTEAQWEFACRAGTTGTWNDGTTISNKTVDLRLDALGWYGHNGGQAKPVGQKKPNAWGLYDMHGNVFEWCLDKYVTDVTTLANYTVDPKGALTGTSRVNRGGGWDGAAEYSRAAMRNSSPATSGALGNNGFRIFRTLE